MSVKLEEAPRGVKFTKKSESRWAGAWPGVCCGRVVGRGLGRGLRRRVERGLGFPGFLFRRMKKTPEVEGGGSCAVTRVYSGPQNGDVTVARRKRPLPTFREESAGTEGAALDGKRRKTPENALQAAELPETALDYLVVYLNDSLTGVSQHQRSDDNASGF